MSNENIGAAAGKIWAFLDKNGASSPSKIAKELPELSDKDINRAIGWLAKEEKLLFEMNGRTETLSLK